MAKAPETRASAINASACPLCHKDNLCAMEVEKATGIAQGRCWCVGMDFSADLLAKVPRTAQKQACICALCAKNAATAA